MGGVFSCCRRHTVVVPEEEPHQEEEPAGKKPDETPPPPDEEKEAPPPTKKRRPSRELLFRGEMDRHAEPPEEVLEALVEEGRVVPCELYGPGCAMKYHGNIAGANMAFSSTDARREYFETNRQSLEKYQRWSELSIADTNADWAMRYGSQAFCGVPFSFGTFKDRLEREKKMMVSDYATAVKKCQDREPSEYHAIVHDPKYASFCIPLQASSPTTTKKKRSTFDFDTKPTQPTTDLVTLYGSSLRILPKLWRIVQDVAEAAGDPVPPTAWSVKKLLRAQTKLFTDYGGRVEKLTDIARASIVCGDLKQLRRAVDEILKRGGVVSLKNRWATPVDGYADVLINLRIDGVICEIQLHTKSIFEVKGETGHSTYKWLRRLVLPDDVYDGDTDSQGRPHGFGRKTFAAGDVYEGHYKRGRKHGLGKYTASDGQYYEGEWADDKKHGIGFCRFANGNEYQGEWKHGTIDGQGTKTLVDGGNYEGQWKNGKPHGLGLLRFKPGDDFVQYKGTFRSGLKDGNGVLEFANGDVYSGLLHNDKPNGQGSLTLNDTQTVLKGNFVNGALVYGTITYADGSQYVGRVKDNLPAHPSTGAFVTQPSSDSSSGLFLHRDSSSSSSSSCRRPPPVTKEPSTASTATAATASSENKIRTRAAPPPPSVMSKKHPRLRGVALSVAALSTKSRRRLQELLQQ